MKRKRKGAFTLYFGVIFMSILLVGLSVMDFARMNVYKAQAQRAMEITANSLITQYDKDFQEKYGFFMSKTENLTAKAEFLLKENFQSGKIDDANKKINSVKMNAAETKEQIVEYMKYRGPLIAVSKIYSMFGSLKSILSTGDTFSSRLDTELSNADFIEALNDYRYYVNGWTFHDDKPDYKYISKDKSEMIRQRHLAFPEVELYIYDADLKENAKKFEEFGKKTNGYFVRSMTDFVNENPYDSYINMGDASLFKNAYSEFDITQYKNQCDEMASKDLSEFIKRMGVHNNVDLAYAHDTSIFQILSEYQAKEKEKEKNIEEKMSALRNMIIHPALQMSADKNTFESLDRESYKNYIGEEKTYILSIMGRIMKAYHAFCKELSPEEIAQEKLPIDTEMMARLGVVNNYAYKQAYNIWKLLMSTEDKLFILWGLKVSNKKASTGLREVEKNLDEYQAYVEKELSELLSQSEGAAKDANYVASTAPKLEDNLEMIALMKEKLAKVKNENKYKENDKLLAEMIQKLCVVDWNDQSSLFDNLSYYPILVDTDEKELILKQFRENTEKLKDVETIKDYSLKRKELKRLIGVENTSFDKEGFLALQKQYQQNCVNVHLDFTKEQLFNQNISDIEEAKQQSGKGSSSLKKILNFAKDIFDSVFSFGSGKELTDEEYKSLPSYIYAHEGEDTELDEDVFDAETGSSKKAKRTGNSSKSWIKAIKNIGESFSRLAKDPLGTIYVNEYIMTAFNSSVTGVGEYKEQINLKFQDKVKSTKKSDLKLESEIEYVIAGTKEDNANNLDIAKKILVLRVLPNMLYIFTHGDTNSLASSLAAAISAFFPPIYPLIYIIIVILWAIAESIIDIFVLRQGQKVAFLKTSGDFMLSPTGFKALAEVFGKIAISKAADKATEEINNTLDKVDNYVTEKTEEAKKYIQNKTQELADKLEEKSEEKIAQIKDFVTAKYQIVESAENDFEKSVDNYIETVVGKYLVQKEKDKQIGINTGIGNIDDFFNTAISKAVSQVAKANTKELIPLINEKLKKILPSGFSSAAEVIEKVKSYADVSAKLKEKISEIRKEAEKKLEEHVFKPLEEEFVSKKEEIRSELQGYLNKKVELGAKELQEYYDNALKNVFTESGANQITTTEKSNSGFRLGYEDYLRLYLIFVEEDEKMFRILDLVQLRENKKISEYMAGVKLEIGFDVKYLFLPQLIKIAKKQSSSITLDEADYESADFQLRAVAGY